MIKLYDKEIQKVKELFPDNSPLQVSTENSWPLSEKEELVLKSDMAMDLGGNEAFAVSGILFTTEKNLVPENKIYVFGPTITQLNNLTEQEKSEINYSRFVVVRLKEEAIQNKSTQQLYAIFRKLDYVRYHIFPKGFVLRISAVQHREAVRISKKAVENNISFEQIGAAFIKTYTQLPEVACVEIYFHISLTKTDIFKELDSISKKSNDITESLNEIFKGLKMDCSVCVQKPLCDEIEGLKELHSGL